MVETLIKKMNNPFEFYYMQAGTRGKEKLNMLRSKQT